MPASAPKAVTETALARSAAVVTGGATGIGLAVAHALAARGCAVLIASRDRGRLEAAREALRREHGAPVELAVCDVTSTDSVADLERAASDLAAREGRAIELVVPNAGAVEVHDLLDPVTDAAGRTVWERMLAVCHLGAVRVAEAFLPGMVERGRGLVVHTASAASLRAFPRIAAYAAAKHALVGWTRAAALELRGTGVAVAALCPYYVEGEMLERAVAGLAADEGLEPDRARRRLAERNPGGALVRPEAVGELVVELAARAALDPAAVDGRVVVLDGGPPRDPDPNLDRAP